MKFYTATAAAAMAGSALAGTLALDHQLNSGVPFTLEAHGGGYDGQRISLLHEGAGLSWAFVNNVDDGFAIDPDTAGLVSTHIPEVAGSKWYAKFDDVATALTFTPGDPRGAFYVTADGTLFYNDVSTFYACSKLEGNLYNYADQAVALEPNGACEEIQIVAKLAPAN